jgi:hypothetical protein
MENYMEIKDRYKALAALPKSALLIRMRQLNPFGGYTRANMSKPLLLDTILRYEFGPTQANKFLQGLINETK